MLTHASPIREVFTYVVSDPRTMSPMYVGKGVWERAFRHHKQTSPFGLHCRALRKSGVVPHVTRIKVNSADEAFELEELLVDMIGRQNVSTGPLFNVRPGGNTFKQAESTRKKLSAAHMGKSLSEAHKESIRQTLTGRPQSEERKAAHRIRMREWWAVRKAARNSSMQQEI